MTDEKCPVCDQVLRGAIRPQVDTNSKTFPCLNCGEYTLSHPSVRALPQIARESPRKLLVLSHAIRKMNSRSANPVLTLELIRRIVDNTALPNPDEQLENLLLWLGDNNDHLGEQVQLTPEEHSAVIGVAGVDNFVAVCGELMRLGWFEGVGMSGPMYDGSLTFGGWRAYQELKRGHGISRKAFMAMVYGDASLDAVFRDCLKPAVARTGFDLRRLDEDPQAGLIDDRLRVEILTSRFLVADLTHGNPGAYWEAGYAEGLDKPVIYTCEKNHFHEKKTHFDTSHHHTVLWEASKLDAAANALKATIRATLPHEAILEDPA